MMPLIALKTGAAKISRGGDKPAGFQLLTAFYLLFTNTPSELRKSARN